MADALARLEPVAGPSAAFAGVTMACAPPMRRWSLRARDPAKLEALLGLKLPRKIGAMLGEIACLGPDEWLWLSPAGVPKDFGAGQPVSVVDVSERSVGFVLDGPEARAVLSAGCPLDLERFAIGQCTRTVYEGVEIILRRESDLVWSVDVWRSFAEWLWLSFNTVAKHP